MLPITIPTDIDDSTQNHSTYQPWWYLCREAMPPIKDQGLFLVEYEGHCYAAKRIMVHRKLQWVNLKTGKIMFPVIAWSRLPPEMRGRQ